MTHIRVIQTEGSLQGEDIKIWKRTHPMSTVQWGSNNVCNNVEIRRATLHFKVPPSACSRLLRTFCTSFQASYMCSRLVGPYWFFSTSASYIQLRPLVRLGCAAVGKTSPPPDFWKVINLSIHQISNQLAWFMSSVIWKVFLRLCKQAHI